MPLYSPATTTADSDATLTTTDITTNNASTSKHGFLKKLSNVSTEYMSGTGVFSTPGSSPAFPDPGYVYDECWFNATTDVHAGIVKQVVSGTSAATSDGGLVNGHMGVIQVSAGTSTTGRCALVGGGVDLGQGQVTAGAVFKIFALSDGTNTFKVRSGLGDSGGGSGDPGSGVFFRYAHSVNSGKWEIVACNNGTETAADSGITADTSWHRYEAVVNAAGTSAQFYIDGASVGTVSSNVPTGTGNGSTGMLPVSIVCSAGTGGGRLVLLDAYWYIFAFTTPR